MCDAVSMGMAAGPPAPAGYSSPNSSSGGGLGLGAIGLQAAGAAASADAARKTAIAQQTADQFQSAVSANNAGYDAILAARAVSDGQTQVGTSRLKYGALQGTQTASLAAHGVDVTQGSAKNILDDTQMMSDMDAATLTDNALKAAWGYSVQKENDLATSRMLAARADAISPDTAMATSLLGSAATVASSWYSRRNPYGTAGASA